MMRLQLKACPKCKTGALSLERDIDGEYKRCIQCGYLENVLPHRKVVAIEDIPPEVSLEMREEMYGLMGQGFSTQEISDRFGLDFHRVKGYKSAYTKAQRKSSL